MVTNSELLFKSISEGIFFLDSNGYIKFINPSAASITGYLGEELLNQSFSIIYDNDKENIKLEYELSTTFKQSKFVTEGWKIKKDGSRFWAELTFSVAYDENKKLSGYTCLLRDNTEKKKIELELRQNEEYFRLMVESVKEYSMFIMDEMGYIISWNEGVKRINGYNANEIIGKHFSVLYRREDIEDKKPALELEIAAREGKYEEEGWQLKKNGSLFWANFIITPLFNEQNRKVGFSMVTRDLTIRKESEEELRQSEERYRLLVEQVIDYAIFMMDERGRIISWNEGAKKIKGYTAAEIIGKYFSIFYPEEDIISGKPAHELRVARATGKYEEEGWRIKKDGTRFWANVVITAVYTQDKVLFGYSKVTRDLTERKASEKALRESYDRYRLLADELKIKNMDLSNANEELEQFTSIVSHDLQEPIRTIKSFLQLIDLKLDEEQTENVKAYIGKAINAANRMKELIQNLLNYSQLDKTGLVSSEVKIMDLFNEALQNLNTSIDTSNAKITIDTDVETIYGDQVQLVQLIQNLVGNALKFTNSEEPEITLKCTEVNGRVRFSISDNGIGISEGDYNKIFEIFRRLNTKKDIPGTGIGLSICKKIVDRHRGRIWPESTLGKGTTFHFTLNEIDNEEI